MLHFKNAQQRNDFIISYQDLKKKLAEAKCRAFEDRRRIFENG